MRTAAVLMAIAVALALQTTLARFVVRGTTAVDLVLVVVVYVALAAGPVVGLLAGAIGGLAQDALSTAGTTLVAAGVQATSTKGIIGIGGLAKTVVGFVTGIVGIHFILARPLPRFVVFFMATIVHALIFIGAYVMLDMRRFGAPYAAVTSQALGNALVGVIAFQIIEFLPGAIERRRQNRGRMRVTRRME